MLTFRCLQTWMCFILLVYLLLHNFDSLFSLFSFLSSLFSSLFNFIPFSLYSSQHQHHLEHSYSFLFLDLFSPSFRMSLICQLNFCFCNLNSCSLLSDFFFCTFHNTLHFIFAQTLCPSKTIFWQLLILFKQHDFQNWFKSVFKKQYFK